MQVNGFKKSIFGGLKEEEVLSYLDQMSRDVETKIRNKDDDIRELKKELSEKKSTISDLEKKLKSQKNAHEEEIARIEKESAEKIESAREEFRKEKEELQQQFLELKEQFTMERDKIGRALLTAEGAADKIVEDAVREADEMIADARRKVDAEKERYKQSRAELTDFTQNIQKLMERFSEDLKERLE